MNQNDMDRYYWRTGQRWSGDNRLGVVRLRLSGRKILLLAAAFAVTEIALLLLR
jgi:hypothetical protein